MKGKRQICLGLSCLAIVLELLPFGAVCIFANPEGKDWRRTFSYFDLVPFGYANFGPLLAALLSCVLLVLCVLALFRDGRALRSATVYVALTAALASLMPLLYGIRYFTATAVLISATLLSIFAISLFGKNKV